MAEDWSKDGIIESLKKVENLDLQDESEQMEFKISYHINKNTDIENIQERLNQLDQKVKLIVSKDKDLDILPAKSGKGNAIKFLIQKLDVSLSSVVVAGDSGNDEDMLTMGAFGIVVSNHSSELKNLEGRDKIYFAKNEFAEGVLEGLEHFKFLSDGTQD